MKPKRKILFIFILALLIVPHFLSAENASLDSQRLVFFYSHSCHACIKVKNEFMPEIEKRFKDRIEIDYRDINDIQNYEMLLGYQQRYDTSSKGGVPTVFFAERFLSGEDQIRKNLVSLIEDTLSKPPQKQKVASSGDILSHFLSFTPLAIISAGLVDGINPCAFTVIVFFISFLSLQGYSKRELIAIGLSFIAVVFLTYLLIGLGLFNFLYRLKVFWHLTRIVNFTIGLGCIILGIFALYDFFSFRKSGRTGNLVLQLPQPIKNRIQRIIGLYYRRPRGSNEKAGQIHLSRLLISTLVAGFLVTILEAFCTGQVYLPTIVFVLETSYLKLEALGYLLLYNFMFIIPLLIIFIFALLGVGSAQFAKFLHKHLLSIKMLMAALFFSLGIFLIWGS